MKTIILTLTLFFSLAIFGQRPSCEKLAAYVGKDKNSLITKWKNAGFKKNEEYQYLGQDLADRLTRLSGIKCTAVTLVNKDAVQLIYIIYNPTGICVAFTFADKTAETQETDIIEEDILSLGYTNDNNSYVNQSRGRARTYTKGKKFFVLNEYDAFGGYSVTAHCLTPKKK